MTRTNADRSPTLAVMRHYGVPETREEFLRWYFEGDVPADIDPEIEAEFPEQFQLSTLLDGVMLTGKIQ
jgi:hypothetical protein